MKFLQKNLKMKQNCLANFQGYVCIVSSETQKMETAQKLLVAQAEIKYSRKYGNCNKMLFSKNILSPSDRPKT